MSTAFTLFNELRQDLANKVHNLASDALQLALTNVAPVVTNAVLGDLTEIAYTNLSSRAITTTSSAQTGGVEKLILANLVLTASGAVATFRYVVLYNTTPTSPNKPLIGFYDLGAGLTLANTQTLSCNFDQSNGVLQLT